MSYEIVYERVFVKVQIDAETCVLPLVLTGSNNCYEAGGRGRDRRARDWGMLAIKESEFQKRYGIPVVILDDADEYIEQFIDEEDKSEGFFEYNGKWIKGASFRRFWNNGLKNAMTIEEINEKRRYNTAISVFFIHRDNDPDYNTLDCQTSEQLAAALIKAGDRRMLKKDGHVIVRFDEEDVLKREKLKDEHKAPRRGTKNWLKDQGYAYVLQRDDTYIQKLTARSIYTCYSKFIARQFKDEKTAQKWKEELYTKRAFNKDTIEAFKVVRIEEEK